MHVLDLFHSTIWLLICLSAMGTQAVPLTAPVAVPLTCDDISCQNNNVCQVRLVNGIQVTDAKCNCQGQWAGEKCELRMYLSILKSTYNSVTFHLQTKTWPSVETNTSVYQLNISEMTLLIKSLKTPYQCKALLQRNVQNTLHLKDINEKESYIVCLASGYLESCTVLNSMNVTKQSNCLLFEHNYSGIENNYLGIVVLCSTLICCLLMSIISIYIHKHHLLFQLFMYKLCCIKKKVKLTSKTLDGKREEISEICMPSDLSMELLSYRWADEFIHPTCNTSLQCRQNDQTIDYSQMEYQDLLDLYTPRRVNTTLSKISLDSMKLQQTSNNSSGKLNNQELNRFHNVKQSTHIKPQNGEQFTSQKLISSELKQSSQPIDSISQYFNHSSYTSFSVMPDDSNQAFQTLPRQRSHQQQPITFSNTLPSTRKSKRRPSSLQIISHYKIKSEVIDNSPPIRQEKNRTRFFDYNQLVLKFSKVSKGNSEDDEFRDLQSPLAEERIKFSKKKSLSNLSTSSSMRFSGLSIFEGHPSEHTIPPFCSNDSYDEEDITETTSIDMFSDLSSPSLGLRDSILSYEDDTSNLVTPFEIQSDSDNDTYKDIDSLNCSMETLQAFLIN